MSGFYGDFLRGKTVRCRFNTNDANGAPATLTGGAVAISKDGTDVTPSGGVTLTVDVGGVVGRNNVVIDMGVDTGTFTAGSEYAVRLSAGASGVSNVGIVVGEWSVENRSVVVDATGKVGANNLPAAPDNAGIAAIKAKTDNLPASPAAVGSAMTLASNGLDAISMTEPATGPPTNYREWTLWLIRRIAQATKAFAGNSGTIKTKKTSGADWTTQAIADDGAGNETVGPPT
jgi:hypothetical protein